MFPRYKPPAKSEPDHYFEIELPADLFTAIEDLIERKHVPVSALERLHTAMLYARRYDLPQDRLPWGDVERTARKQGCSVVDIIFDRAHGKEPS